jgi:hypothetical protein
MFTAEKAYEQGNCEQNEVREGDSPEIAAQGSVLFPLLVYVVHDS